jgi:uncharacterized protein (DUF1800 family)
LTSDGARSPPRASSRGESGATLVVPSIPEPERRLLQRIGLGPTQAERARLRLLGYQAYLEEQLAPESLDDQELEQTIASRFPALSRSPAELYAEYQDAPEQLVAQLVLATIQRAVASRRQLQERMVAFWTDHFNVDVYSGDGWCLLPAQDRDVVRPHAMGSFPQLLGAASRSPALLSYLSNTSNLAGKTNDDFGRELLELHTLGRDQGYTEQDVREVARCFTGWGHHPPQAGAHGGAFRFTASDHDQGPKAVLGHYLPAGGGLQDGETVLQILAEHPATARHLARKLAIVFWGEDPPASLVEEVANRFRSTGGDIRAVLRALLQRPNIAAAPPRLKRPFELAVSLLRTLEVESWRPMFLLGALIDAGQMPFAWPRPDGYPMERSFWSGSLFPRWRLAVALLDPAVSGVELELPELSPALSARQLVDRLDALVAGGNLQASTRRQLLAYLSRAPGNPTRIRKALALALAAPELQEL